MSSDRPPLRADGFPERPTPRRDPPADPALPATRAFTPPKGSDSPSRSRSRSSRWLWPLGLALVISLIVNAWQAGKISVLEAQLWVQPDPVVLTVAGDTEEDNAPVIEAAKDTAAPVAEPRVGGVWQVDTASPSVEITYDEAPSRTTETQRAAMRLYLKDLDDAFVETTDAPMSEEIAGEILDMVTTREPVLLDLKIVAIQLRIARVEAIVPPKEAAEHHRLTLLELGQGERLLEILLRSRDGTDPGALELADEQAARLVETSKSVQQLTQELKSGQGTAP